MVTPIQQRAIDAEKKLAQIARSRRPTEAETAEANEAYRAAAEEQKNAPRPPLRKARFQIDADDGLYEGYTDGSLWNGWANVWFTLAQAQKFVGDDVDPNSPMGFEDGPEGPEIVLPEAEWVSIPEFNAEVGEKLYSMNGLCFVEVDE